MSKILGFIWALPLSILGWILFGLLWASRQMQSVWHFGDGIIIWDLSNTGWVYTKLFLGRGFSGFSLGCNVIVIDSDPDVETFHQYLKHERKHCFQQFKWGILWHPAYLLISIWIYLLRKDLHSYLDNYFEIEAREAAGQQVHIPRSEWPHGPDDRWIFW
jgi:hypothetical protein